MSRREIEALIDKLEDKLESVKSPAEEAKILKQLRKLRAELRKAK
jgi:hypothetical protein